MKKFLVTLSILLASGLLVAQVVISPPSGGSSGSTGTITTGAINDVPCYSAATTVGPCETGILTYNASTHQLLTGDGGIQLGTSSNQQILPRSNSILFVIAGGNALILDNQNDTNKANTIDSIAGNQIGWKGASAGNGNLNGNGKNFSIGAGESTGNGTAGYVSFQTGTTGVSSSTENPLLEVSRLLTSGANYISGYLVGWNSAATFASGSQDTALARNAAGVIESNNGSPCSTQSNCRDVLVRNLLSTNGTAKLTISSSQATAQTLTIPAIREAETVAIKPQASLTSVAAPTGTTSTASFVMLGLGANITPQVTGRVSVVMSGNVLNTTLADGCNAKIVWGTGTNPVNGAAASGTVIGSTKNYTAAVASAKSGAAFNALLTGAVINTQIWVDLQFEAVTGGTCTFGNMDTTLMEY